MVASWVGGRCKVSMLNESDDLHHLPVSFFLNTYLEMSSALIFQNTAKNTHLQNQSISNFLTWSPLQNGDCKYVFFTQGTTHSCASSAPHLNFPSDPQKLGDEIRKACGKQTTPIQGNDISWRFKLTL